MLLFMPTINKIQYRHIQYITRASILPYLKQKQLINCVLNKISSQKFSLYSNKFAGTAYIFDKKRHRQICCAVNFAKSLKTPFYEHLWTTPSGLSYPLLNIVAHRTEKEGKVGKYLVTELTINRIL